MNEKHCISVYCNMELLRFSDFLDGYHDMLFVEKSFHFTSFMAKYGRGIRNVRITQSY